MADGANQVLSVGTTVRQRYQILSIVGRGGLGTVYQVSDVLFGKNNIYALKELLDQSPGARKQFAYESRWLQSLDHNNIPKFREYFEWGNRLYLVMDFVDGENLEQKFTRQGGRPMREGEVLRWILPICDALQYLHTRMPPILHRDVKPANIIVTSSGHPVLVDLGIAKEHLPGAGQTATFVRKAGTEGYAPPEQYTSTGKTGPWSDVYGLGATLYHLLTGGVPPTAVDRVALDRKLLRPREVNPTISPQMDDAIMRALALRPVERFRSVQEFALALMTPTQRGMPSPARPISMTGPVPSLPPARPSPASNFAPSSPAPITPSTTSSIPSTPFGASALSGPLGIGSSSRVVNRPGVSQRTATRPVVSRTSQAALPSALSADFERGERSEQDERAGVARLLHVDTRSRRGFFTSPPVFGSAIISVILVAVVLGVVLLSATTPPDRSSPIATITGYFNALRAQDYNRAWQYSSASRNDVISQSSFTGDLASDDARDGRVLTASMPTIEQQAPDKVTATVNVTRADAPGVPVTYLLNLTQYDGNTWLIDGVTTS